ncbi:MAG TPA: aldolase/citrate lyase family protein [Thermoanaerobaculia bacterium]|nr:aldolase/citrate lyase family protein [Thermoanaerobaculia bacterium]
MVSAERFLLTLWTADPRLARTADEAGVDRIGVDLEQLGKEERQRSRGTWISPHHEEDLDALAPVLARAKLFARINPINPGSEREVESVLARGAQVLMLPMAMDAAQAAELVRLVRGRAEVVLLVEHIDAMRRLREIVRVSGVSEVHIGLNDLAISLGLRNRWMALANGVMQDAGAIVRGAGLRFGLGGIGRAGDDQLPVPADLIYAEYARTGATSALLARSFFVEGIDLAREIDRARAALEAWRHRTPEEIAAAHAELARCAARSDVW